MRWSSPFEPGGRRRGGDAPLVADREVDPLRRLVAQTARQPERRLLELGHEDPALPDRHEAAATAGVVADLPPAAAPARVELRPDAVAPGIARDHVGARELDAGDARERLGRGERLGAELGADFEVLQVAAAAVREVRAGGLAPAGARREQLDDLAAPVVRTALDQANAHPVARRGPRHEDRNAIETPQPVSASDQLLDPEIELVDLREPEAGRGAAGGAGASGIAGGAEPRSARPATRRSDADRAGRGESRRHAAPSFGPDGRRPPRLGPGGRRPPPPGRLGPSERVIARSFRTGRPVRRRAGRSRRASSSS